MNEVWETVLKGSGVFWQVLFQVEEAMSLVMTSRQEAGGGVGRLSPLWVSVSSSVVGRDCSKEFSEIPWS